MSARPLETLNACRPTFRLRPCWFVYLINQFDAPISATRHIRPQKAQDAPLRLSEGPVLCQARLASRCPLGEIVNLMVAERATPSAANSLKMLGEWWRTLVRTTMLSLGRLYFLIAWGRRRAVISRSALNEDQLK
jgi:hypothetical protein